MWKMAQNTADLHPPINQAHDQIAGLIKAVNTQDDSITILTNKVQSIANQPLSLQAYLAGNPASAKRKETATAKKDTGKQSFGEAAEGAPSNPPNDDFTVVRKKSKLPPPLSTRILLTQ